MRLRTKTTIYFCVAFICTWTLTSLLLFTRFKKILLNGFDESLRSKAKLVAGKTSLQPRVVPLPENNELFMVLYRSGYRTDTLYSPLQIPFAIPAATDSVATLHTWRTIRLQQPAENGGTIEVLYAASSDGVSEQIQQLTIFLWLVLAVGAVLSGFIAWYFSSRLLRPLRQVIRQTNAINLYQNTAPLPLPAAEAESQELVTSINRMLTRIQEQAERQTAFFAAASHELRTPLSVMQTQLQVLLQAVQGNQTLTEAYSSQLGEVQKLSKMVNDFLLMSQLQSGRLEMQQTTVDLIALLTQVVERKTAKAMQRQNTCKLIFLPEDADFEIAADEGKTEVICNNLLDNAVKYAAENTIIQIVVQREANQVSVQFTNAIRGDIHPDPVDIKNAFYHSKPLHGEGFGLGLWIASQLAALQNMDLYCSISSNSVFTATLVSNV